MLRSMYICPLNNGNCRNCFPVQLVERSFYDNEAVITLSSLADEEVQRSEKNMESYILEDLD
jgi:hypothetical protein